MFNSSRISILITGAITTSLLLTSSAVFAANYKGEYKSEPTASAPPALVLKDGPYVGVAAGYDSYRMQQNFNNFDQGSTGFTAPALNQNPSLNATGGVGNLFAGYGKYFEGNFYLGAEIFGNWSGANISKTTNAMINNIPGSFNSKISVNGSYGVSLLPGIKLNDSSLLYVRLGYTRARIKDQENVTSAQAAPLNQGANGTSTNWVNGFTAGVGIESAFYQNWSIRGEYNHTSFNSFTNTFVQNYSASPSNVTTSKISPSDNQFLLGLIYHIDG